MKDLPAAPKPTVLSEDTPKGKVTRLVAPDRNAVQFVEVTGTDGIKRKYVGSFSVDAVLRALRANG